MHYDHQIILVPNVQNSAIKPDIMVLDMDNKTGLIAEMRITADFNLNRTCFKKNTKYIHLATKIKYRFGLKKLKWLP